MRVRFLRNCNFKGKDGVIREYAKGVEANLSIEDVENLGGFVVSLELITESFDEAPADKMVKNGKHK
jgi:hypothetical protein